MTDQNMTVRNYLFDQLGRQVQDEATTLGSRVDFGIADPVRRVQYGYDLLGNLVDVRSYDNPAVGSGSVLNEVFRRYNQWGLLGQEYQSPAGAITFDGNGNPVSGTPNVGYQYDAGAASTTEALPDANTQPAAVPYLRLKDMIYPTTTYANGGDVGYLYSTGSQGATDNAMSLVSAITDGASSNGGSPQFATYTYQGTGTIVGESRPELSTSSGGLGLNLTVSLDQFGRVQDQKWATTAGTVDEYKYGYDADGNVLWKQNAGPSANGLDEAYTYNGMNELASVARGTLNGGQIISQTFSQTWDKTNGAQLDSLGNFVSFNDNNSPQQRTVNAANEIQSVTGSGATTPSYDKDSNLTSDGRLNYVYDAWNQQVAVNYAAGGAVGSYTFDGLGRRVSKTLPGQSPTYYYYSQQGQVLEEDQALGGGKTSVTQYVWNLSYIDTPVVRLQDATGSGVFTPLYYTADANHNVTGLVDGTGTVVERYVYTPYGQVTFCQSNWTPTAAVSSAYGNVILYCGYRFDPETAVLATTSTSVYANYQVRAREYSSLFSTFTTRDPAAADVNLYRYCGNEPTERVDPRGLETYATDPQKSYAIAKCSCDCWKHPFFGSSDAQAIMNRGMELARAETYNTTYGDGRPIRRDWVDAKGHLVPEGRIDHAMRHCITAGLLARAVGSECAACLGNSREIFNYLYGPDGAGTGRATEGETVRTLLWDLVGREAAGQSGTNSEQAICQSCKNALYSGKLMLGGVNDIPPGLTKPDLPNQPPAGTRYPPPGTNTRCPSADSGQQMYY